MSVLGAASAALALAQVLPPGGAPPPPVAAPAYVNRFCAQVASGYADGPRFRELLSQWKAHPAPEAEGRALQPEDAELSGQFIRFEPPESPAAFVSPRTGDCALVWPAAQPPASELESLRHAGVQLGEGGPTYRWLPVAFVYAGRPRPPKWLLPLDEAATRGVCAEVRSDLRRRDGAPVSLVRLQPCRLASDERTAAVP